MSNTMLPRRAFAVSLAATALVACSRPTPAPEPQTPPTQYRMTGEVRRLESDRQIAVIKHDDIEGWMEAMTMEFPVRDKTEFAKLSEGMRIRATVNVQDLDYWLTDIQPE